MSSRRARLLAGAGLVLLALVAAGIAPGSARAAVWCGTTASANRPAVQTGRPIRVIYAVASDGVDRSAELAQRISADIDDIGAWWRLQDPTREPRFDLASFACGLQVDLTVVRLPDTAAQLLGQGGVDRIFRGTMEATSGSVFNSYLVYYDGPVDDADVCGIAYGADDGPGQAIVFVQACDGVASETTAAHEVLHTLGALAAGGPPNACPDTSGHPCDSETDILYPYANGSPLGSLVLDFGHDDYYAHGGSWPDVQDSPWLRHLDAQTRLNLAITGKGGVASDVPGVACVVSCATDWDTGSTVALAATPAPGQRFLRWVGACAGSVECSVTIDAATTVGAVFAQAAYRLTIAVKGKGAVALPRGLPCRGRCSTSRRSYQAVSLRPRPDKGWRLARWTGACSGTRPVCRVPMTADTLVGAVFKRK